MFGALSDYRGRREVVLIALVLEIVAVMLFWGADSVGWLLAARILQGAATGIATSALGAGLVDLHRERGSLINSVAPMVGLGLGALGASVLVQFAPAPTRLVFELLLAAFVLQLAAAFFLPETTPRRRRCPALAQAQHEHPRTGARRHAAGAARQHGPVGARAASTSRWARRWQRASLATARRWWAAC